MWIWFLMVSPLLLLLFGVLLVQLTTRNYTLKPVWWRVVFCSWGMHQYKDINHADPVIVPLLNIPLQHLWCCKSCGKLEGQADTRKNWQRIFTKGRCG